MKHTIIALLLLSGVTGLWAQSTREVKTYYDVLNTHIKAIEIVTDDNKLHGVQKYYYENGDLREQLNMKFDKKEGLQKSFFHNGKIKYANNYKEGVQHGESKEYRYHNEKYYLYGKQTYDNGKIIESIKYYPNGKMQTREVLNGTCGQWYENGQKAMEYTFASGLSNGEVKGWSEDGKIIFKGYYKDNKVNGQWDYYGSQGKVIHTEHFSLGKKTGKWKTYYDAEMGLVSKLADAQFYQVVDYDSQVPEEVFKYSNTRSVYVAKTYFISGKINWEGYMEDNNGEGMDYKKMVTIPVGKCTYYLENGKLNATGTFRHNRRSGNSADAVRVETWHYYDENGQLIQVDTYDKYGQTLESKTGDQLSK